MKNIFSLTKLIPKFNYVLNSQFSIYTRINLKRKSSFSIHFLNLQNKNVHSKFAKLVNLVNNSQISNLNASKMTEILTFNLEKANINQFEEDFNLMEINNIKLSNDEINKILHIAYKKHPLIISKIYEYCIDFNIKMNSLNYHFFINSFLEKNQFMKAYSIFLQANFDKILLDLSTIFNLYTGLKLEKDKDSIKEYIDSLILRNYDSHTSILISDFNEMKHSNEGLKHKHFKKIKKSKKKQEEDISQEIDPSKAENKEVKPILEEETVSSNLNEEKENVFKIEERNIQNVLKKDDIQQNQEAENGKTESKNKTKLLKDDEELNEVEYLNYKYFQKLQKQNFQNFMKLILKLQNKSKYQSFDIRILDKKDLKELNFENENGDLSGDE